MITGVGDPVRLSPSEDIPKWSCEHGGNALRIALVTPIYLPSLGGIERHVHDHAEALQQAGCDVTIIAQCHAIDASSPREEHSASGVVVRRFPVPIFGMRYGLAPGLLRYLFKHQSDFDVIHTWNYHAPLPLAISWFVKRPLVFTAIFHGDGHGLLAKVIHRPYRRAAGRIFEGASTIVCNSPSEARALSQMFPVASAKIEVIAPGMPASAARRYEPFEHSTPVVLSASRLEGYKQVDKLVRAVALLRTPARLVVVGDGPEREALRTLVASESLSENVELLGRVDDATLGRWRATAHVLVSLSRHESFGLSLSEGLTQGLRIVASDLPAHRDLSILADVPFHFVPVDAEPSEIAEAIAEALKLPLSQNHELLIPTWEEVATRFVKTYQNAIEGTSAQP